MLGMPYSCWTHFGVIPFSHDKGASAEVWFPAGTNFAGELKTGAPMCLGNIKLQKSFSKYCLKDGPGRPT